MQSPTIITLSKADLERVSDGTGVQVLLRSYTPDSINAGSHTVDLRPGLGGTWQPVQADVEVRQS